MAEQYEIYKCEKCNTIIEVLHAGVMDMKCCGSKMKLFKENTVDAAREKHVPVLEKISDGVKVKVGEVAHPMVDDHYIEWIEVIADGKVYRQFLNLGDTPEAEFKIDADQVTARAYCNLHGLWKA